MFGNFVSASQVQPNPSINQADDSQPKSFAQAKIRFAEYVLQEEKKCQTDYGFGKNDVDSDEEDLLMGAINLVRESMENQMVRDFNIDLLVAKYALAKVEYRSVEEATEIIYGGTDEDDIKMHPFFGYVPDEYEPQDIELGQNRERCFICQGIEAGHQDTSADWDKMMEEEARILERFDSDNNNLSKRQSSHLMMQESMRRKATLLESQVSLISRD